MPDTPILAMTDIKKLYPTQWVLLDDLEVDPFQGVVAGRVIFHSADRDEVYDKMGTFSGGRFAVRYTGPIPANGSLFAL